MTKSDYELVAKTLRAHYHPRASGTNASNIRCSLQEISLALGLVFEEECAQKDQETMQDEISKSFDLTQFLKECEP